MKVERMRMPGIIRDEMTVYVFGGEYSDARTAEMYSVEMDFWSNLPRTPANLKQVV
jgi:hypothetical protein